MKNVKIAELKISEDYKNFFPPPAQNEYDLLKEDIEKNGITEPITINGKYEIVDGYTRYRIACELGLDEVPVKIVDFKNEEDEHDYMLRVNFLRRHLNPWQKAMLAYKIYPNVKEQSKERKISKLKQHKNGQKDPNGDNLKRGKTLELLADMTSSSYGTLQKAFIIFQEAEKDQTFKEKVEAGIKGKGQAIDRAYMELKRKRKQEDVRKQADEYKDTIDFKIYCGDFREQSKIIPANSIDFVFSDPPYLKEYKNLWEPFAKESARIVKPGGYIAFYFWQQNRYEIETIFRKYLSFHRCIVIKYAAQRKLEFNTNAVECFKFILVFYKEPYTKPFISYKDLIDGEKSPKLLHHWEQPLSEAQTVINIFSKPGDVVCDLFSGSGTILVAALMEKRRAIGFELEEKHVQTIKGRVAQLTGGIKTNSYDQEYTEKTA